MNTNDDTNVSRKPSKRRRISKKHASNQCGDDVPETIMNSGCQKDKSDEAGDGILHQLLGNPPSSIRLFGFGVGGGDVLHRRHRNYRHALSCFQTMLTIIHDERKIPAVVVSCKDQWKEIHGFLILQLGNISFNRFSSDGESDYHTDNDDAVLVEVATKLCSCLREIYRISIIMSPYSNDELQVAFTTIVDHLSNIIMMKKGSIATSSSDDVLDLVVALLRTLVRHHHEPDQKEVEKATLLLVHLLCDFQLNPTSSVYRKSIGLLEDLVRFPNNKQVSYTASLSLSAIRILQRTEKVDLSKVVGSASPSNDDEDFPLWYWRCLAQSKKGATQLSQNLDLLDDLVQQALRSTTTTTTTTTNQIYRTEKNTNSHKAAQTLSFIARNREEEVVKIPLYSPEPDWTMDALLRVLTASSDPGVKSCTIFGLQCCRPESIPWQNAAFLHSVIFSLSLVATCKLDMPPSTCSEMEDCKRGAVKILLDILEPFQRAQQSMVQPPLSYNDALSHVNHFLQMQNEPELQQLAVKALVRDVQHNGPKIVLHCPVVLQNLSLLLRNRPLSASLTQNAMDILETVSRSDKNEVASILTRQPKVLEALVAVASSVVEDVDVATNPKRVALVILMRLAQQVCNRRILAKHVGVLACMIRYARSLSDELQPLQDMQSQTSAAAAAAAAATTTTNNSICLSDLKQKIMELATAI